MGNLGSIHERIVRDVTNYHGRSSGYDACYNDATGTPGWLARGLVSYARELGYEVKLVPHGSMHGACGQTECHRSPWGTSRVIRLDDGLTPAGFCRTLTHELTHAWLNENTGKQSRLGTMSYSAFGEDLDEEITAETVASLIGHYLGSTDQQFSTGYLRTRAEVAGIGALYSTRDTAIEIATDILSHALRHAPAYAA